MSLDSLLGLFNTFSQTNHHNFALAMALAISIMHNEVWRAVSKSCAEILAAGRSALSSIKRVPLAQIALGLLVIFSILIVFTPASVQAIKGAWAPVSLSAPGQPNDFVSSLPRTTEEVTGTRQTETLANRDALVRKTMVVPVWVLMLGGVAVSLSLIIARFKRVIRNLSWFHYLCQLLDLPPPASVPASA